MLLDRLVQHRVAFLDEVGHAARRLPRCRGSRQAREVAALADGLAESPLETRLRLLLHRAGLPAPVAQYGIRQQKRFVARVDFGYPEQRLAVEYDGAWHGDRVQFARDRQRLNRLLSLRSEQPPVRDDRGRGGRVSGRGAPRGRRRRGRCRPGRRRGG
ncbi:hypothetical protein [Blastococcus sp. SYSU DS0973]